MDNPFCDLPAAYWEAIRDNIPFDMRDMILLNEPSTLMLYWGDEQDYPNPFTDEEWGQLSRG